MSLRRWLVAACLLAPAYLLLRPVWHDGQSLFVMDTAAYFLPHKELVQRALQDGELPTWNPFAFAGMPLAADPNHNVWHPLVWLFALLPLHWAYHCFIAAHLVIAAWGYFRISRTLGLPTSAAVAASVLFCSTSVVASFASSGQVAVLAFMPWLLDATLRSSLLGIAFSSALMIVSGTTDLAFAWCACCGVLALAQVARQWSWRPVATFVLGLAWGAGLSAVQWLPTLAFYQLTAHAQGFADAVNAQFTLTQARWPELVHTPTPAVLNYIQALTWGAPAVWLAALALPSPPRISKILWPALLIALLFLLYAFGPEAQPVYGWMHTLPIVHSMRFVEKLAAPIAVLLPLLIAASIARLARTPNKMAVPLATGAVLVMLFVSAQELDDELIQQTLLLAAAVGCFAFASEWRGPALAAVLSLSALVTGSHVIEMQPARDVAAPPAILSQIPRPLFDFRIAASSEISNDEFRRLRLPHESSAHLASRTQHDCAMWAPTQYLSAHGSSGLTLGAVKHTYMSDADVLDWFSVKWFVECGDGTMPPRHQERFRLLRSEGVARLYENPTTLSRVFSYANDAFDVPLSRLARHDARALEVSWKPTSMSQSAFNVRLDAPTWVVQSDVLAPGWQVTVDGSPASAKRFGGLFRAIHLEPGQHEVEWRYEAPGLRTGAWLSAMTLCLTLVWLGMRKRFFSETA